MRKSRKREDDRLFSHSSVTYLREVEQRRLEAAMHAAAHPPRSVGRPPGSASGTGGRARKDAASFERTYRDDDFAPSDEDDVYQRPDRKKRRYVLLCP